MKKIFIVLIWVFVSVPLLARGGGDAFVGGLGGGLLGGVMGSAMTQSSNKGDGGHGVVRELDKLEGNVRAEFEKVYRAIDNLSRDIKEKRPTSDYDIEALKESITSSMNSMKSDVRSLKKTLANIESRLEKIEDEMATVKAPQRQQREALDQVHEALKKIPMPEGASQAEPARQPEPVKQKENVYGPIPTIDQTPGAIQPETMD